MRKNIFAKSTFRQPMRTILLMLLIAVAAFAFVMRSTEYIIVTEKIEEIGNFYRSVGMLFPSADHNWEVSVGAEIVAASSYLGFEDRRRGALGVLQGMPNSNPEGFLPEEIEMPRFCHGYYLGKSDAFFYGELIDINREVTTVVGHRPAALYRRARAAGYDQLSNFIELTFLVDYVLLGYPEHFTMTRLEAYDGGYRERAVVTVHYHLTDDEILNSSIATPIDAMVIGQRYFLRGVHYFELAEFGTHEDFSHWDYVTVRSGARGVMFYMRPINERTSDYYPRYLTEDGIWFIPVTPEEEVDFSMQGLAGLNDELIRLRHIQSSVQLRTTRDLTAMPFMLFDDTGQLIDGRLLDKEDYLNANPVAVVNVLFAQLRNLNIGDTITVGIPPRQREAARSEGPRGFGGDFFIKGAYNEPITDVLKLEIVGMFSFSSSSWGYAPRYSTYVFIPDSVLPSDIHVSLTSLSDPLIHSRYSFVLQDPRNEDSFMLENRDILSAMGFDMHIIPGGGQEFRDSADSIIQSLAINAILFSAIMVLILALVSFLYLRQRRRDFAISRTLGCSENTAVKQLIITVSIIGFPAAFIGGIGGWFFALRESTETLLVLSDAETVATLPIYWLFVMVAIVLAVLLTMVIILGIRIARKPILVLLQDSVARRR